MGYLDKPITIGISHGMVVGFYEQSGTLPATAIKILQGERQNGTKGNRWVEEGVEKALKELGLIKRRWFFGPYKATHKGRDVLKQWQPPLSHTDTKDLTNGRV